MAAMGRSSRDAATLPAGYAVVNLIAVLDITHPDLSLAPTIRECSDVTIRVVPQSGTDPETGIFFFLVENPSEGFETQLDEDHTVAEWELVAGSEATRVYRIRQDRKSVV